MLDVFEFHLKITFLLLPALLANRLDWRLLEATGLQAGQAAAKGCYRVIWVIIFGANLTH
ncbi:MAG: hypothetical protein A2073_08650 [Deltaproteobacteria bacterium GWC2_42_11]|nr:MAG: hypothetical protein A2073_08650 [Deltaproteobacteria bacterium GWC2_42_11]